MKILQINASYKIGSTGKIMADLNSVINNSGHSGYMLAGYGKFEEEIKDSSYSFNNTFSPTSTKINLFISRLTGTMGYRHKYTTKKAIEWIDSVNPNLIHLHNIHGDWINIFDLFNYIKSKNIPVVWTLHDCWSFTGRCSHFENCNCEKWKTGCFDCSNNHVYPITYFFDHSAKMWKEKNKLFSSINNMILVTPSDWLKNYVEKSYLNKYPVITIHNGIDLSVYKPIISIEKKEKAFGEKKIILGVASMWTENKGLFDFYKLAEILSDEYQVVLVGLNDQQIRDLPTNIIGIKRTRSINDLVELYSMADYYVNMTYLDNYPTTNLEAQACGTPTITYMTGGSPESVEDSYYVVNQGDVESVASIIRKYDRKDHGYFRNIALRNFSAEKCFASYLEVYNSILNSVKEEL